MRELSWLKATIYIVIGVIVASVQCGSLQGAPHYSILVGAQGTGSYQFAMEFSRLWKVSKFQMPGFLFPIVEKNTENRIRRLRSRQGDFAIISPQQAHLFLTRYPEISVITVLWPNALHVVTSQIETTALRVDTQDSFCIHHNSTYFVASWSQLSYYDSNRIHWFTEENSLETLSSLENRVLLVTAPYPLKEIHHLLLQPAYKLIPLDDWLITFNRTQFPWLSNRPLPANIYPNTTQPVPTLTSFPVLITRVDTSLTLITQMLKILFPIASENHHGTFPHSLFRFLEPQNNFLFRNSYRFHMASKKRFKF